MRPRSFWRCQFERAGFIVERRIFGDAAIEFPTYVTPVTWMPLGVRLLEPLRIVPIVNLLLCDRDKYCLRKAGVSPRPTDGDLCPLCTLCRGELAFDRAAASCCNGHRFDYNPSGLINFTELLRDPLQPQPSEPPLPAACGGSRWADRLRRPYWARPVSSISPLSRRCSPWVSSLAGSINRSGQA